MSKDWLDELLDNADWGYQYRISDYATSKDEEKYIERSGKKYVEELKQQIRDKMSEQIENENWHRTIGDE